MRIIPRLYLHDVEHEVICDSPRLQFDECIVWDMGFARTSFFDVRPTVCIFIRRTLPIIGCTEDMMNRHEERMT